MWLQCVKQYIEVQIDDNNVSSITCPDPDCRRHGVIDAAEVNNLLFCAHLFKKILIRITFEKKKLNHC